MAYTGTKATAGKGLALSINTGTASSPTWSPVGESFDAQPSRKMMTDEATNFDSAATEYISTMPDGGEMKFSCNRVSTDAGQIAVEAAASSGALKQFKIVAPIGVGQITLGDAWTFSAIVVEFNPSFKPEKKTTMSGTLRTSNGITFTVGS